MVKQVRIYGLSVCPDGDVPRAFEMGEGGAGPAANDATFSGPPDGYTWTLAERVAEKDNE